MSGLQRCNSTLVARQQRAVVDTASNIYYNHPVITIEQNQLSSRRIHVIYMYIGILALLLQSCLQCTLYMQWEQWEQCKQCK